MILGGFPTIFGNTHINLHRKKTYRIGQVDSLCGARGESGESDAARRIKTEFLAQCCWRCFLEPCLFFVGGADW